MTRKRLILSRSFRENSLILLTGQSLLQRPDEIHPFREGSDLIVRDDKIVRGCHLFVHREKIEKNVLKSGIPTYISYCISENV